MDDLEQAKEFIRQYIKSEFSGTDEEIDEEFSDLTDIGLAVTNYAFETGKTELNIEVIADLEGYEIRKYINNILWDCKKYGSLHEMNITELAFLNYDELTELPIMPDFSFMGCVYLIRDMVKYSAILVDEKKKDHILVTDSNSPTGYRSVSINAAAADLEKDTAQQFICQIHLDNRKRSII